MSYRQFTFTLNNWDTKPEHKAKVDYLGCWYMVYGKDVSDTSTPHLQGHCMFRSAKTESAACKALDGCHMEVSKDPQSSITYCKKDGDVMERGTAPLSQSEKG